MATEEQIREILENTLVAHDRGPHLDLEVHNIGVAARRLAAIDRDRVDVKPLSESWDNLTLFLGRLWGPKKDWEDVQRFAVNCVALEVNELKAALSPGDTPPTAKE